MVFKLGFRKRRSDGEEDRGAGEAVAPKSTKNAGLKAGTDGIFWYNPLASRGLPYVWDDGVHQIAKVDKIPVGIAYVTNCGLMFTFYTFGQKVQEARIDNGVP